MQEFRLNPNAKSFVPSQSPLRPPSPVNDSSFYFPASMPTVPHHMHGMPVNVGVSSYLHAENFKMCDSCCFQFCFSINFTYADSDISRKGSDYMMVFTYFSNLALHDYIPLSCKWLPLFLFLDVVPFLWCYLLYSHTFLFPDN